MTAAPLTPTGCDKPVVAYPMPRPPLVTSPEGFLSFASVVTGLWLLNEVRPHDKLLDAKYFTPRRCGAMPAAVFFSIAVAGGVASEPMLDEFAARALSLPRSPRWREAVETALIGGWDSELWDTGYLPPSALGALKAEARTVHRQLMPVWRRRTRHGRVLSLDADLGGLSLYELVAADVDLLAHTAGGVFEDDRLNRVLRGLDPAERAVVFAYAEGEGTTWTEAATAAGATDPAALGERVRRKAKRIAAEQARRTALTSG
ncbi:hypothetical protein [Streptomyces chartreusis]|uniref:hypothetical protein n=1 Tax=Streptomyces chartreusis TaxID=1969 RepID=UPI0036592FEC